jgi:hypothetical protein
MGARVSLAAHKELQVRRQINLAMAWESLVTG